MVAELHRLGSSFVKLPFLYIVPDVIFFFIHTFFIISDVHPSECHI